jgi:Cof subfamily protein (haloacid dehalogenase superfamily)
MIKLMAMDLAGTLLDNNFKLQDFNREALAAAHKKGITVVLATGKLIYSILPIIESIGLKSPQITCFGATVITGNLKILDSNKICSKDYLEVVRVIREKGYNPMVTLEDNKIYYDKEDGAIGLMKKSGEKILKVGSIEDGGFSKKVVSISIITGNDDLLYRCLVKKFSSKMQIMKPAEHFISILNLGVSKGKALSNIMKLLNIGKGEVAAFGDSLNDISMFDRAGLKIAVKNAHPELLAKADVIAEENYNNGAGKAIYKYILEL